MKVQSDVTLLLSQIEDLDDYLDDRLEDSSLSQETFQELNDIQTIVQHILKYDTLT